MLSGKGDSGKFYRPELDALRCFAFLLVYICHIAQDAGISAIIANRSPIVRALEYCEGLISEVGAFGVCLFFLLSSYLITELMLIEFARTGGFKIKDFYLRRILRIWPLYFFVLAICIVLGWIYPAEFHVSLKRLIAFLALSGNWYLIFGSPGPSQIGVLWSISIEEQFYLLWPGIFLLGRRRGILFASIFFPLVTAATLAYLGIAGVGRVDAWMNSLVQFLFFALGGLLALLTHKRIPRFRTWTRCLLIAGGLTCWMITEAFTRIQNRETIVHSAGLLTGYTGVALGTVAIFLGVLGIRAEVVPQWMRYLGKISYGLYVFHPLTVTATIVVLGAFAHMLHLHGILLVTLKLLLPFAALALTIAVAAISYRFLETPFLKLRRRFTVVANRPI